MFVIAPRKVEPEVRAAAFLAPERGRGDQPGDRQHGRFLGRRRPEPLEGAPEPVGVAKQPDLFPRDLLHLVFAGTGAVPVSKRGLSPFSCKTGAVPVSDRAGKRGLSPFRNGGCPRFPWRPAWQGRRGRRTPDLRAASCSPGGSRHGRPYTPPRPRRTVPAATSGRQRRCPPRPSGSGRPGRPESDRVARSRPARRQASEIIGNRRCTYAGSRRSSVRKIRPPARCPSRTMARATRSRGARSPAGS